MMAPQSIPQACALSLYCAMLTGNEPSTSYLELRPIASTGEIVERSWVRVCDRAELAERIVELAPRANVFVGVCPRVREAGTADAVERSWVLWCDADSPEAVSALRRFEPRPSMVISSGRGLHGYWQLSAAAAPNAAARANRRLARALSADPKSTDPARVLRPPCTYNHKREAAVLCTYLDPTAFDMADVVGGLPDDPSCVQAPSRALDVSLTDGSLAGLVRVVSEAPEGERNDALHWGACRAWEREPDAATTAVDALRMAALQRGLPEREVDATLASARREVLTCPR